MKKFVSLALGIIMLLGVFTGAAYAEKTIDIGDLTVAELVQLEHEIEDTFLKAVWDEDTVLPIGRYTAGEDFPIGNYVITASSTYSSPELYIDLYGADKTLEESYTLSPRQSCEISMTEGRTMVIDSTSGFEIDAKIRTLAGYMLDESVFDSIVTETEEAASNEAASNEAASAVAVPATDNSGVAENTDTNIQSVFTYELDKWDLYKATFASDSIVKIDLYYRVFADESTPFSYERNVAVISTEDPASGFTWLDDAHTAFSVSFTDARNSKFAEFPSIMFCAGDIDDAARENIGNNYEYQCSKWDLYKAKVVSNQVVIEHWYRVYADDQTPFAFNQTVLCATTDDSSTDFKWLDEGHSAFSLTLKDEDNSRMKEETLTVFTQS